MIIRCRAKLTKAVVSKSSACQFLQKKKNLKSKQILSMEQTMAAIVISVSLHGNHCFSIHWPQNTTPIISGHLSNYTLTPKKLQTFFFFIIHVHVRRINFTFTTNQVGWSNMNSSIMPVSWLELFS